MGTDTAALIEAAGKMAASEVVKVPRGDGSQASVLVLPEGREVHDIKPILDSYLPAPERKRGTAQLTTIESFIAHANRFKGTNSAVFADDNPDAPKLLSVIDYHEASAGSPRFCEHRGSYAFPVSDEWKAWKAIHDKELTQIKFAEFLEDRIGDVTAPGKAGEGVWGFVEQLGLPLATAAELLELSRGLTVNVDHRVANHTNLSTGEGRVHFETEHKDASGAQIKVPGGFALSIPVFRNGVKYKIAVRLRYRVSGGITWRCMLYRTDLTFQDAFGEACKRVQDETSLPVFTGKPET
jgi:uncharacterized protein YfdQ (DUF2303 family)